MKIQLVVFFLLVLFSRCHCRLQQRMSKEDPTVKTAKTGKTADLR